MELLDIVNKLVGPIEPIGETNNDNERFDNLKTMCELVDDLLHQIYWVSARNRLSHEASVKKATNYSVIVLKQILENINMMDLNDH